MQINTNKKKPYGTWPSTITPEMVTTGSPKYQEPAISNNHIYWLQSIAEEKGRVTIMRYDGTQIQSILPRPLSAKSKVHEYGGGSYLVDGDTLYFVLADDQRVYRYPIADTINIPLAEIPRPSAPFEPIPLTPELSDQQQYRFADLCIDHKHQRLIAVCEHHCGCREPKNFIASIDLQQSNSVRTLVSGNTFYSNPRLSPDGKYLSWLSWDHPDMPWDATQLWLAELLPNGQLAPPCLIAGQQQESIFQPQWSPNGVLYFVSDRDNWWNIYRYHPNQSAQIERITHLQAEFATPQWTFNMSTYGFLNEQLIIATYFERGIWKLAEIDLQSSKFAVIDIPTSATSIIYGLNAGANTAVFVGASECLLPAVFHLSKSTAGEMKIKPIQSPPLGIDPSEISSPQLIEFDTTHGDTAFGYFYPPANAHYHCDESLPPLIVICHGGPTGSTDCALNLKIQYWTNRGFAVMDIDYRGSTGYGRVYRQKLYGNWGEYDIDDICAGAKFAVNQGWVNSNQLIVKGSSAGGYTVLAALTFRDTFHAGVSLYGIGDLNSLVEETHKFEARYLDKLVGDFATEKEKYKQRSPIHFPQQLNCPILIFQGSQDKVVPPNQAIRMVTAVKSKGLPVAYVEYHDEAHGFRNAENISHMLKAEHFFYSKIFDFEISSELENFIQISNL